MPDFVDDLDRSPDAIPPAGDEAPEPGGQTDPKPAPAKKPRAGRAKKADEPKPAAETPGTAESVTAFVEAQDLSAENAALKARIAEPEGRSSPDRGSEPGDDSRLPLWSVSIPIDRTAPKLKVRALTEGDAHLAYKKAAGIISTEQEIKATRVGS